MPSIFNLYDKKKQFIKDCTVIRLHGPDRKGIEKKTGKQWNEIVEPKDEELNKLKIMIKDLHKKKCKVYINVNNHYEGSAPLTIEKINKV